MILKSSSVTSFPSSLIMVSMLSFVECVKHSSSLSSLEEIQSIVIANWIFDMSDFLRLFMIFEKFGLNFLSRVATIC